jgi:hypothetical protein
MRLGANPPEYGEVIMPELPAGARPIDAAMLRKCAESADGIRGQYVRLVYAVNPQSSADEVYAILPVGNDGKYSGWTITELVRPLTMWIAPSHSTEAQATVTYTSPAGTLHAPAAGKYDALFWSESAVEKFVLPYYARHLDKDVYDLLYRTYMALGKDGLPTGAAAPTALIHLPTSEYDTVSLVTALGPRLVARLGLLTTVGVIVDGYDDPQPLPKYVLATGGLQAFAGL